MSLRFLYNALSTQAATECGLKCPGDKVLDPIIIQLLHLQDASISFVNEREAVARQLDSLVKNLQEATCEENVFTGLVTFIDDDPTLDTDPYCYKEELPFGHGKSHVDTLVRKIEHLENIPNIDDPEGTLKATYTALKRFDFQLDNPKGLAVMRVLTHATDNPSKIFDPKYVDVENDKCSEGVWLMRENHCRGRFELEHSADYEECFSKESYHRFQDWKQPVPSMEDLIKAATDVDARLIYFTTNNRKSSNYYYGGIVRELVDAGVNAAHTTGSLATISDTLVDEIIKNACKDPPTTTTTTTTTTEATTTTTTTTTEATTTTSTTTPTEASTTTTDAKSNLRSTTKGCNCGCNNCGCGCDDMVLKVKEMPKNFNLIVDNSGK